jgi:hypothetical protein
MRHHAGRLHLAVLLALPSFVAAHDVIFLLTYGARNAAMVLSRDGHGAQWIATVVSAAMTVTVLIGVGTWRLLTLAGEARAAGAARQGNAPLRLPRSLGALGRELLALWPVVLLGAIAMFVITENVERLVVGQPAPGLAVLASNAYVDAPLVLAAISGLVSLVAALYAWERDVLVRRIALARRRWQRRSAVVRPANHPPIPRRPLSGQHLARRAPPAFAPLTLQA